MSIIGSFNVNELSIQEEKSTSEIKTIIAIQIVTQLGKFFEKTI